MAILYDSSFRESGADMVSSTALPRPSTPTSIALPIPNSYNRTKPRPDTNTIQTSSSYWTKAFVGQTQTQTQHSNTYSKPCFITLITFISFISIILLAYSIYYIYHKHKQNLQNQLRPTPFPYTSSMTFTQHHDGYYRTRRTPTINTPIISSTNTSTSNQGRNTTSAGILNLNSSSYSLVGGSTTRTMRSPGINTATNILSNDIQLQSQSPPGYRYRFDDYNYMSERSNQTHSYPPSPSPYSHSQNQTQRQCSCCTMIIGKPDDAVLI